MSLRKTIWLIVLIIIRVWVIRPYYYKDYLL